MEASSSSSMNQSHSPSASTASATEESSSANVVEACSWDLTGGAATNVFGKILLRSTSASSNATPEAIDHVGIIAFNRLYEYGHHGVKKSNIPRSGEDPNPQYPGCKLRKREYLGKTSRTKGEFIEWIVNVKYGEYKGSNYDMIHHNCLDFARAACLFLCVPPNPNWEKISNWAKNNQKIAGLFSRSTSPNCPQNRRSRSLQQNGRSLTIPEDGICSGGTHNENGEPNAEEDRYRNDNAPLYAEVVSTPRRNRRLSINPPISYSGRSQSRFSFRSRSASMETLPPTYEEALRMSSSSSSSMPRRDSIVSAAPSYDSYMKVSRPSTRNTNNNGNCE